jgi:translation initiation factor IF-2
MSVRVYRLAKQLGLDSRHVIQLLRERGLDVNSPSNTIPAIYADALIEEIGNKNLVFEDKKTPVNDEKTLEAGDSISVSNTSPEVVQNSDISSGFETKEVVPEKQVSRNSEQFTSAQKTQQNFHRQNPPNRSKKPVMISIGALSRNKKRDDEPEVRLPELPKKPQVLENNKPEEKSSEVKFRPFLKKIERQVPKISDLRTIEIKPPIIVRALATQMNIKPFQLISKLMSMNIFASMNQEVDFDIAEKVAEKFGYALQLARPEPEKIAKQKSFAKKTDDRSEKKNQNLVERPPVVCVLGHVDHGKTTLLDTIRHARVAAGEAGGITQHVAAYQVEHGGKKITFIDTPGHAAFSKMRERGANITDIGILIVAADDGFMPQTDEALKFAKKANIPIVVAINKIDAKGANVDRVKQQMQQRGIAPEDWGGETLCATISALHGTNIENLLELIQLQAEMMELRADALGQPEGVILESQVTTGHGVTASAIIEDGILKIGDCIICGPCYCKVRSLIDDRGQQVKAAPASMPVNIIGWSEIPEVGTKFTFVESEKAARKQVEDNRLEFEKNRSLTSGTRPEINNIDQLFSAIAAVEDKVLNVILRADVHGSMEALRDFLGTIDSKKIKLNILDYGVGTIDKNDVTLADASKAQIIAFNVKIESNAQALSKRLGVKIVQHNIIYELVERVREAMAECLDPELHENKLGAAEVRQIFDIKGSVIAGCMVTEGKIMRDKFVRVIRKKEVIFQGKFESVRRQKEDTGEVRAGFECGIVVAGFDAFATGDIIECFEIQKVQPAL